MVNELAKVVLEGSLSELDEYLEMTCTSEIKKDILNIMASSDNGKDIIKNVEQLGKHLKSYEDYNTKLGNAISTTVNQYNLAGKEFKKIDKDVLRITGDTLNIETLALEKPDLED